ncbi:RDD family protein [Neolewinella persica]|uniref:RDD family protein n=1 Tax=Neolewinella persica TaxID=70998 RepID=UPI000368B457|nr:RDD family protein [Neolewinella persica]
MYASDTLDDNLLGDQDYTPRFANFGPRLGAALLDFLFTLPLVGASLYFTMFAPSLNGVIAITLLSMLYKPVLEKTMGATLGKMVLKLKVVAKEGLPISWTQAWMRYLPWLIVVVFNFYFSYQFFQIPGIEDVSGYMEYVQLIAEYQMENGVSPMIQIMQSLLGFLPLISALVMLGNARRQSGHDIIAETYVIHTQPKL